MDIRNSVMDGKRGLIGKSSPMKVPLVKDLNELYTLCRSWCWVLSELVLEVVWEDSAVEMMISTRKEMKDSIWQMNLMHGYFKMCII